MAELADALDLGSSGVTRESSSLSFRTISFIIQFDIWGQCKNTVELTGGASLLLSIFTLTPNITNINIWKIFRKKTYAGFSRNNRPS